MNGLKYWFAVALAFALIVSLSWCAKAQEAQVGPKWEPVRIEVVMHRVHHVHHHRHHHVSGRIGGRTRVQACLASKACGERYSGPPPMPPVTSPLYIEFVTWCVARALPCILPYHERN